MKKRFAYSSSSVWNSFHLNITAKGSNAHLSNLGQFSNINVVYSSVFQSPQIALVLRSRAILIVFEKLTRACSFRIALETMLLYITEKETPPYQYVI